MNPVLNRGWHLQSDTRYTSPNRNGLRCHRFRRHIPLLLLLFRRRQCTISPPVTIAHNTLLRRGGFFQLFGDLDLWLTLSAHPGLLLQVYFTLRFLRSRRLLSRLQTRRLGSCRARAFLRLPILHNVHNDLYDIVSSSPRVPLALFNNHDFVLLLRNPSSRDVPSLDLRRKILRSSFGQLLSQVHSIPLCSLLGRRLVDSVGRGHWRRLSQVRSTEDIVRIRVDGMVRAIAGDIEHCMRVRNIMCACKGAYNRTQSSQYN